MRHRRGGGESAAAGSVRSTRRPAFRPGWFLRFLGVNALPEARLENREATDCVLGVAALLYTLRELSRANQHSGDRDNNKSGAGRRSRSSARIRRVHSLSVIQSARRLLTVRPTDRRTASRTRAIDVSERLRPPVHSCTHSRKHYGRPLASWCTLEVSVHGTLRCTHSWNHTRKNATRNLNSQKEGVRCNFAGSRGALD